MHIFCCGRSTIIESQVVRRKHARSPYGTRACPVRERLEGYVLCGAAAIRKLFKSCGARTGDGLYGRFYGAPEKIVENLAWLGELGITRCTIAPHGDATFDQLAPLLFD